MVAHDVLPRWWVITSGEYSDYRVHAVFEDEATAIAAVAEFDDEFDTYEIEPIAVYRKGQVPEWVTTYSYREWFGSTPGYSAGWSESREPAFNMLYQATNRAMAKLHRHGNGVFLSVVGANKQAVEQSVSDNKARIKHHFDMTGSYHQIPEPVFYFENEVTTDGS